MNATTATPARPTIAILIYPGVTLLDMAGPQATWGFHADTLLVWEKPGLITTDGGASVMATHGFDDCPSEIDVLCVPGGFGTWDLLGNDAALSFLRRVGANARYVTSVCTGSIVLAAAGLLDGYKAATHWATYPVLEALGIEGVHERVVIDRNRISGGGITAGIDFGLTVLAELLGPDVARTTQLMLEYAPQPPFNAGLPDRAGPEVTAAVMRMLQDDVEQNALPAVQRFLQQRQVAAAWLPMEVGLTRR